MEGSLASSTPPEANGDEFRLLCGALSRNPTSTPGLGEALSDLARMDAVLALAVEDGVLASLHVSVERHFRQQVAKSRRIVLATRYEENRRRNLKLRQAMHRLGQAASRADFDFVTLKGAAWLLENNGDAAWREMIDIDLLVEENRYDATPTFLESLGGHKATDSTRYRCNFHQSPYYLPEDLAVIEVHRHLGWRHRLLPPDLVRANATIVAPGLRLPAPWCRAFHTIIHWQIQDHGRTRQNIPLKQLVDLKRFLERADVDWAKLVAHAHAVGARQSCEAAVALAAALLDAPVPDELPIGPVGIVHVRRASARRASNASTWLATQWWRASTLWHCEKVAYRLGIKGAGRRRIGITLCASRAIRLPILALRLAAIALRWPKIWISERRSVG